MTELLERINRHLEFLMDCTIEPSDVRASTQKLIDEIKSVVSKPKSNADKIRQMTEHDLAEMIALENICAMCEKGKCEYYPSPDYYVHRIEEWLKQEAKDDDR